MTKNLDKKKFLVYLILCQYKIKNKKMIQIFKIVLLNLFKDIVFLIYDIFDISTLFNKSKRAVFFYSMDF